MVRRGRLSKGCQTCRKRKIKCDQLIPSCSQCRKAGWTCPQYGDVVDRLFQHSDFDCFTIQPTKRKHAARSSETPKEGWRAISRGDQALVPIEKIPIVKTQSLNERAIQYFLITNTFRDDKALRGFYEYLPSVYQKGGNELISASLTATSLAAFGNRFRYPDVLNRARRYYGKSLYLLNRALQAQINAATDCTMISILLLNTFEALTAEDTTSLAYSEGHMKGEMMVLKLRGHSLMDTRQGLQMFEQISRCLITYCLIRPAQVPVDLLGLRDHAAKYLDTNDPAWLLEEIMIKLASFHANVHNGIISGHWNIIQMAVRLDKELCLLAANMPPEWSFEEISSSDGHFPPRRHIYPSLWTAYIWNYIRTCRLRLQKEICNQLSDMHATQPLTTADQNLWLQARQTTDDLVIDVCASVDQYRAQLLPDAARRYVRFNVSNPVPAIAGVYFLLWPLLVAGHMAECKAQRAWIITQCRLLGRLTGIQRITTVAETLASRDETII